MSSRCVPSGHGRSESDRQRSFKLDSRWVREVALRQIPPTGHDVVFERARLGLAGDVDSRPEAEARYAYRGMRERYGMVRARESLLPVELVVQGELDSLQLGAFPRLRTPKTTPDAVLIASPEIQRGG